MANGFLKVMPSELGLLLYKEETGLHAAEGL